MIVLAVHFDQLRLKVFAYVGEVQTQLLDGISIKHMSPACCYKDPKNVHYKNAGSS